MAAEHAQAHAAYASTVQHTLMLQGNSCWSTLAHPTLLVTMTHIRSHKVPGCNILPWHQLVIPMQEASPLPHRAKAKVSSLSWSDSLNSAQLL